MKLAIFPNNRVLRFGFVFFSFLISIWLYYALQPQIEAFSETYRWNQFDAFVRLWVGVFWLFLILVLTLEAFQKSNKKKEFGDGYRGEASFTVIPVALIILPLWKLAIELGNNGSILDLVRNSPKELGAVIGGSLLLVGLLELRTRLSK